MQNNARKRLGWLVIPMIFACLGIMTANADVYPQDYTVQVYAVIGAVTSVPTATLEGVATNTGASCASFKALDTTPKPEYGDAAWQIGDPEVLYTVTNLPSFPPGDEDYVWYTLEDGCDSTPDASYFFIIEFICDPNDHTPRMADDVFCVNEGADLTLDPATQLFTNDFADMCAAIADTPAVGLFIESVGAVSPAGYFESSTDGTSVYFTSIDSTIPDAWGTYTFTYTATNDAGGSGTATVTVDVPCDLCWRATGGDITVEEKGTGSVAFTSLYLDPDPTSGYIHEMILITTNTTAGGLVTLGGSDFIYTAPNANFPYCCDEGHDDFEYAIRCYDASTSLISEVRAFVNVLVTDVHYDPGMTIVGAWDAGTFTESETATIAATDLLSTNVVTTINCPDDMYICAVDNPTPQGGEAYIVPDSGGDIRYTSPDDVTGTVTDTFNFVICDLRGGAVTGTINAVINDEPPTPDTCESLYTVETNVCEVSGTVTVPAEDLLAAIDCPCDTLCITGVAATSLSYGNFYVTQYDPACTNNCCISAVTYVASPMDIVGIGTDYFEYYGNDCSNNLFTGTLEITVRPVVDPSEVVAADIDEETDQDTALSISVMDLLDECSGYDGLDLALEDYDATTAEGGTVVLSYTRAGYGVLIYTPPHGFRGEDSFEYEITDGTLASCGGDLNTDIGVITIDVIPNLSSPIAEDDFYYVATSDTLAMLRDEGVLANDWSHLIDETHAFPMLHPWDVMEAVLVDPPQFGDVALEDSGSFVYEADEDFVGIDYFTYQALDGDGLYSEETMVFIIVTPDEYVQHDYDGDGMADIGVVGPQCTWFVDSSSLVQQIMALQWGWADTIPAPGDYDGDMIGDVAVYYPVTGDWYILGSIDGELIEANWGWSGAIAVPADYDGDGYTDVAVYAPATGDWYVDLDGFGPLNWGWSGAYPVAGDYDGDGTADMAVYDPAGGNWYINYSMIHPMPPPINWGWAGAEPVPADYDGDGDIEPAVFDPSTFEWYIYPDPTPQAIQLPLGAILTYPIAVPADYDGDGMADMAIYDAIIGGLGTGIWYIDGETPVQWGYDGAWPVSSAPGLYGAQW